MYCKHCYKMIPDDSESCPVCGKSQRPQKPIYKRWWVWVIAVFVLGIFSNFVNAITPPSRADFVIMAENIIEDCLKSPSSAEFCKSYECMVYSDGNIGYVRGYVDSQNGFGAMVRGEYAVQLRVTNKNSFTAEPLYIKFNDEIIYGAFVQADFKYLE